MILHDAFIIRCVSHLYQCTIPVLMIADEQPECVVTPQIALAVCLIQIGVTIKRRLLQLPILNLFLSFDNLISLDRKSVV